jgi:hypothetical protein
MIIYKKVAINLATFFLTIYNQVTNNLNNLKLKTMKGFFNISDQNTFLGGQNVHNLIIISMLGFLIFKQIKK